MIVRTLDEITDTERDVRGNGWRAQRLLVRDDGLGFSLSETTVDAGAEMNIWYKHHLEATPCRTRRSSFPAAGSGKTDRLVV